METLIVGLFLNIWTWSNADFFDQRSENERLYDCEWVDVGWQRTNPKNPSINLFGLVKYYHVCETKTQ